MKMTLKTADGHRLRPRAIVSVSKAGECHEDKSGIFLRREKCGD